LLLALEQALIELEQEGGAEGRAARYRDNHFTLVRGMAELGFEPVVRPESRSHLLTRFRALPGAPQDLPAVAASCGYRIAAGPTVASMGRIYPSSIEEFTAALKLAVHAPQPAA
jgi:aspartate aminotransferase-like enzyme